MIRDDISEYEYKKHYEPFLDNYNDYLDNYIIPDVVAFYIANSYYRKCLCNAKYIYHINSALSLFNYECNVKRLIPQIEKVLKIKYNLIIKKTNPLRLERYF